MWWRGQVDAAGEAVCILARVFPSPFRQWRLPLRFLVRVTPALCLVLFTVAFGAISSAQQKARSADETKVIDTVKEIFAAAKADDVAKFNSVVTPGYYMFDGGERFDGDAIMKLIRGVHAKGIRYEWNVVDPDVHVIGKTAWIAYVNRGSVTDEKGKATPMEWLESAFLEKQNGTWKISFVQSTRVAKPSGK
jgi:ketosteroid isomerase-like protein